MTLGILVHRPETELLSHLHWKRGVLTTGLPWKSILLTFDCIVSTSNITKLWVRKINTFLPLVCLKDLWISKVGSEAPGFPGVWNVSNWFKLAWRSFQVWKWWPLPGHLPSSFSCLDLLSYSPDGTSCFSPSPSVKRAHLVCRRRQKNACLGLISINIFFANKFV